MGGTFSPPHIGHLHSAECFIMEMKLDKLIIIPAKVSPFKIHSDATASDTDRMEMTKLCFSNLDSKNCSVEISDIEISKNKTSYTIETIKFLKSIYPNADLYMYVGSDMFLSLERWHCFDEIFKSCHIYTRCREQNIKASIQQVKEKYENLYGARVTLSKDKEIVVSSTDVRNALESKNEQSYRNLLTENVLRYIINRQLYNQE